MTGGLEMFRYLRQAQPRRKKVAGGLAAAALLLGGTALASTLVGRLRPPFPDPLWQVARGAQGVVGALCATAASLLYRRRPTGRGVAVAAIVAGGLLLLATFPMFFAGVEFRFFVGLPGLIFGAFALSITVYYTALLYHLARFVSRLQPAAEDDASR